MIFLLNLGKIYLDNRYKVLLNYKDGLGTLWSILFNLTNIQDICFGGPVVNNWYSFDLNTPEGVQSYKATLPNERVNTSNMDAGLT